jgi:hypothetical protein
MPSEGLKPETPGVEQSPYTAEPQISLQVWYQLAAKHIQMKYKMVDYKN